MAGLPGMWTNACTICRCNDCLFIHLGLSERGRLVQLVLRQAYNKGETIFQQGDEICGCHILCHGKVALACCTTEGQRQIVRFLSDGELFGESGLSGKKASSVEARALAESVIGWLRPEDLQDLLKQRPLVAIEIQKRLTQEVDELILRLTERSYRSAHERLVRLLLALAGKYGRVSDQGICIDFTEGDLAGMLGNTREWTSKQLCVLKEQGLIVHRRGELVILDEAGLRQHITPPRLSAVPSSQFLK